MQRGNGPRSRCRSRFPGSQTAVGGGPRLRTGGTTQVHRLRTVRLAALLVGLAMVAAACGGGGDEGGDTSGGSGAVQQGGTLNYAADQEPTGFNHNTSKDNGTSVLEHHRSTCSRRPFHPHPDFTVKINDEFLDSAEQTSEDPQTVVYKIKQNAVWSDGTPVSADDFIYLWENCNGTNKDNDVASTTGYDQIESVDRAPTTARRSPSSTRTRSPTGSRPRSPTSCRPTTSRRSRAAGTPAWTRTPRRSPRPARSSSRTTPPARA